MNLSNLCVITVAADMSRPDLIAAKLNSVGLETTDELREVMLQYFCEGDSDDDSSDGEISSFADPGVTSPPHTITKAVQQDRPIFCHGYACTDDTSSLNYEDKNEDVVVSEFLAKPCCNLKCTTNFSREAIMKSRMNAQELNHFSKSEHLNFLHVSLLGGLNCCLATGKETNLAKNKNHERKQFRGHFMFQSKPVCKEFYLFLHGVSDKVYRRLKQTILSDGIMPRPHQNTTKTALVRAHPVKVREDAVKFLENFAVQNALILPGRVPAFKNPDLLLLPCEFTKKSIHKKYLAAVACTTEAESLPYSSFTELWRELLPNICIQKPRSDLCSVCKLDTMALSKLRSLDEDKRKELLERNMQHLNLVDRERQFYKTNIDHAKESVENAYNSTPTLNKSAPCTFSGTNHYSFDYFQQVHIPWDPDQVGALYFLTPYKIGLFGVMCEPLSKMALFIIPEGSATGKGSNQVISMLHYYFQNLGLGETEAILNADNCVGQNKNQFVMSYLCWRVMVGLHRKIILHFLVVGHTKFSPDYAGGVFKKIFRRTPVATPQGVADCASKSSILHPVITGSVDGKQQAVPMYDWQSKFSQFKSVPGMKKYHVFKFSSDNPGVVLCRQQSNGDAVTFTLVASDYCDENLPPTLPSLGLTHKRKSYLYDKIRQFVPDVDKNELCPMPDLEPDASTEPSADPVAVTTSRNSHDEPSVVAELAAEVVDAVDDVPQHDRLRTPKRKPPKCSNCGTDGHRNLPSQCPLRKNETRLCKKCL